VYCTVRRRPRSFLVTPYRPGPDGVLRPEIPSEGVCAGEGLPRCKLNVDHRRQRSTGPCFPLTVMRCRPHRRAFTLYPPGHVPYGRVAVVAVAPDGSPIRGREGIERFEGTLFTAALDAAAGRAWHREHVGSTDRWWGTQLRRLKRAARLLALAPAAAWKHRGRVADLLALDGLLFSEQAERFGSARGYRERGAAVRRILEALPPSHVLPERLVECGTLAGCWGASYRWLPQSATLRRPLGAPGTRHRDRPP